MTIGREIVYDVVWSFRKTISLVFGWRFGIFGKKAGYEFFRSRPVGCEGRAVWEVGCAEKDGLEGRRDGFNHGVCCCGNVGKWET